MPSDFLVTWLPANLAAGELIGFQAGFNNPGIPDVETITFRHTSNQQGYVIKHAQDLTAVDFPNLTDIAAFALFNIQLNDLLISISAPLLTGNADGDFNFSDNAALVTLYLPSLGSTGAINNDIHLTGLSSLQTLNLNGMTAYPIANLDLSSTALQTLQMAAIGSLAGDLLLPSSIVTINLDSIGSIIGSFIFTNSSTIDTLNAPNLGSIGVALNVSGNTGAYHFFSLPSLVTVGTDVNGSGSNYQLFDLPALQSLGGNINLENCASLGSADFTSLDTASGDIRFSGCSIIVNLLFPSLNTISGGFFCADCTGLDQINFGPLSFVGGAITGTNCTSLTLVTFEFGGSLELDSVGIDFSGCSSLTTLLFSVSNIQAPANDSFILNFSGCALTQASVDRILELAVNNVPSLPVNWIITLSGGTNATPSATGLTNKATLIGNGCTVTTN